MSDIENRHRLVWDIPTRLFHWAIILLIFFQWFSIEVMDDWMDYHELGGYALLTLIIFRICWGLVGTYYAKFSEFLYSPKQIISYAKSTLDKDSKVFAGHNPLGGLAVILMLLLLLTQAVSGLFMTDDIFFYGPYYSAVSDETQKLMSRLHSLTFDILLWIMAIHIIAVIFYVFYKRQPLIRAMFTGIKPISGESKIDSHKLMLALVVLGLCVAGVYGLVEYWAPETIDYF